MLPLSHPLPTRRRPRSPTSDLPSFRAWRTGSGASRRAAVPARPSLLRNGPLLLWLFATLTLPAAASAQTLEAVIEVAMQVEAALLDSQLQRYAEARTAERRAFQAWDGLIRELDRALRDSSSSIRELRDLEQRATLARETALTRARQVTDLRASLIDRMERIAVLEERLAREGRTRLVPVTPVDGLWRVAVEPIGVSGLVRLRADGALVSGTYRMENGSQGSVTGTYAAGRLVLERIDVRQGFDATLEGDLDVRRGVVRGTWRSVDVTGGAISGGTWTATKLSPEERRQVESELDE